VDPDSNHHYLPGQVSCDWHEGQPESEKKCGQREPAAGERGLGFRREERDDDSGPWRSRLLTGRQRA
jgi:hypothetical protein